MTVAVTELSSILVDSLTGGFGRRLCFEAVFFRLKTKRRRENSRPFWAQLWRKILTQLLSLRVLVSPCYRLSLNSRPSFLSSRTQIPCRNRGKPRRCRSERPPNH